ncbi:MAG TPA: cytochrome c biogenesis protein CcsA [Phycisphaerae bacterium]|nr:cytochrome c biogenesis protein CcsA [Phycisphaerae bacterium]HRY67401.1 cytochrome c biogenesis protein CcsA [Phycisphaerae bacterium]HSA29842.1 cytochrome c biogenesis protein CcsA [Phycisphaerae bacterium]
MLELLTCVLVGVLAQSLPAGAQNAPAMPGTSTMSGLPRIPGPRTRTAQSRPATFPQLPNSLDIDPLREWVVQHEGRYPPLDTLARDVVRSVTGKVYFEKRDPILWLLAWTFQPEVWVYYPVIPVSNSDLRGELGLSRTQTRFSYADLLAAERLQSLSQELRMMRGGRKLDPLQSGVRDINEKLALLRRVFQGEAIRLVPGPAAESPWRAIGSPSAVEAPVPEAVRAAWHDLGGAFLAEDANAFTVAGDRLVAALDQMSASERPDERAIATELRYNRLFLFRKAYLAMAGGAILALIAALRGWKKLNAVAVVALVLGFAMLSYGLWLRWTIAGRIPASNMYESLLFLSWGTGAFGIVSMLLVRDRIVPITASGLGALALILAETLPLDPFIRPIAPVLLDTVWMSIHVPVIMLSYSVLALAALAAHVQLVFMACVPRNQRLTTMIDAVHSWYMYAGCVLLAAGIATGSMWASSSWGRYWGWDPKEVWSLIAFLAYLAVLHLRADKGDTPGWVHALGAGLGTVVLTIVAISLRPLSGAEVGALFGAAITILLFVMARGPFATAFKSVLAFWTIVMTYVGVNYVLGIGVHSYGFGTGAVVRYMFLIGGIDLSLIVACAAVYLLRSRVAESAQVAPV